VAPVTLQVPHIPRTVSRTRGRPKAGDHPEARQLLRGAEAFSPVGTALSSVTFPIGQLFGKNLKSESKSQIESTRPLIKSTRCGWARQML
jgi:hypothetical protein